MTFDLERPLTFDHFNTFLMKLDEESYENIMLCLEAEESVHCVRAAWEHFLRWFTLPRFV